MAQVRGTREQSDRERPSAEVCPNQQRKTRRRGQLAPHLIAERRRMVAQLLSPFPNLAENGIAAPFHHQEADQNAGDDLQERALVRPHPQ